VRGRSLAKLRHKNYDGSDEEWSEILKYVLISKQGSGLNDIIKQNLDISCAISGKDPKASLSISFRTRVENITQRLGSLDLPQTPDTDDVDLFGWASKAINRRDELEGEVAMLKQDSGKAKDTVAALQSQLDNLVKSKAEHEDELLTKFVALLNAKKMRLRELERKMSTGKIDKKALERLEATLPPASSSSKRGKKRSAREARQESESDDSDGFEAMDVDKPVNQDNKAVESDDSRHTTDLDTETGTEEEDNLEQPVTSQTETGSAGPSRLPQQDPKQQSMPPRRELPFTRQAKEAEQEAKPASPQDVNDEETASEDDEL
jgi:DNA double-strand break repair and V(D)J recombination protein XRCC4